MRDVSLIFRRLGNEYFRFRYFCVLSIKWLISILIQVSKAEGEALSIAYRIDYCEVSVADNSTEVYTAFDRLICQCRERKDSGTKQPRKFSVSKMIGMLTSTTYSISTHQYTPFIHSNRHSNRSQRQLQPKTVLRRHCQQTETDDGRIRQTSTASNARHPQSWICVDHDDVTKCPDVRGSIHIINVQQ